MSVATSTSRISHVGNNSTSTAYVVNFPFALDGDLVVVKTLTSTGAQTTLALSTDYSVTGAGVPAGGSIVTVAAIPSTYTVTIYRQVTLIQPLEYEEADSFPASSHEGALDRLTYIAQQSARSVLGSFRLRESDGDLDPFMLVDSAVVGTDASGAAKMLSGADIQAMLNLPATVIDQPTKTLADDAARAAAVPDFLGQIATQLDTNGTYVGTAITAGSWVHTLVVDASVTAAKLAATLDLSGKTLTLPASFYPNVWVIKTSAYDAVAGNNIAADTSGGAFAINLPASPSAGNSVWFADAGYAWNSENLTVGRNGKTINGTAADLVCNVVGKVFCMVYNGTTWRVMT